MSNIIPRYITHPFKYLRENYSVEVIRIMEELEVSSKKIVCLKQKLRFLHRCKRNGLIPKSLRIKTLVKTQEGRRISENTERKFLVAGISKLHCDIQRMNENIDYLKSFLSSKLQQSHLEIILDYLDKKSAIITDKIKANLIKKIVILQEKRRISSNAFSQDWVENLSTRKLSPDEESLLSKGMKFAISCNKNDMASFIAPIEKVIIDLPELESNKIRLSLTTGLYSKTLTPGNLTSGERRALNNLRKDTSIIILPADKGKSTIIMNRSDYDKKLNDLLLDGKTYEKLDKDPTLTIQNKMNRLLLEFKNKGFLTIQEYKRVHCTNGCIPKFYGLPKIHKEGVPLRPIVSFLTSPCYNLSKYLSDLLYKYSVSEWAVKTSEEFSCIVRENRLHEMEICVSFDVVALFTSIPTDLACKAALEAIEEDQEFRNSCNLPPEKIIELLQLCLNATSFINRGVLYRQKFGTAMGSPVSPTIANLVMKNIEMKALSSFIGAPRIWVRYVDDIFAIIHKDKVDEFLVYLNSINEHIKFTMEKEVNEKISFLDVMLEHDHTGHFETSVYRKNLCTDRLLDYHSNHPLNHKISMIKTLVRRAEKISSNDCLLEEEKLRLFNILKKNNYPEWLINRHLRSHKQSTKVKRESGNKRICLPYKKGLSETTKRLLKKNNIDCTFKPCNTLRSLVSHPKDFTQTVNQSNVVYSIPCGSCDQSYVGQTGRCLRKRIEEHQDCVNKKDVNKSAIAFHVIDKHHNIDWDNSKILHKNEGIFERLFLEGWEVKRNRVFKKNRATPIPEIYNVLMN